MSARTTQARRARREAPTHLCELVERCCRSWRRPAEAKELFGEVRVRVGRHLLRLQVRVRRCRRRSRGTGNVTDVGRRRRAGPLLDEALEDVGRRVRALVRLAHLAQDADARRCRLAQLGRPLLLVGVLGVDEGEEVRRRGGKGDLGGRDGDVAEPGAALIQLRAGRGL